MHLPQPAEGAPAFGRHHLFVERPHPHGKEIEGDHAQVPPQSGHVRPQLPQVRAGHRVQAHAEGQSPQGEGAFLPPSQKDVEPEQADQDQNVSHEDDGQVPLYHGGDVIRAGAQKDLPPRAYVAGSVRVYPQGKGFALKIVGQRDHMPAQGFVSVPGRGPQFAGSVDEPVVEIGLKDHDYIADQEGRVPPGALRQFDPAPDAVEIPVLRQPGRKVKGLPVRIRGVFPGPYRPPRAVHRRIPPAVLPSLCEAEPRGAAVGRRPCPHG